MEKATAPYIENPARWQASKAKRERKLPPEGFDTHIMLYGSSEPGCLYRTLSWYRVHLFAK